MKSEIMEQSQKKRLQKPVGIYVLSIAVIIVLGLFQLLRYWNEFRATDGDIPFIMAFVPLFLCMFTIASAIWIWFGDNWARIVFLIFVTLNFLWWFYLVVMAISYSEDLNRFGLIMTLIRPGLVLGFTWWYLNSKEVVYYFKNNKFD